MSFIIIFFVKFSQVPNLLGLGRKSEPYTLLGLHTDGDLVWPYLGRALVLLGVNQVLSICLNYCLNVWFYIVKTCFELYFL